MTECKIHGCLSLKTTCNDCGRVVTTADFPKSEWISVKDRKPTPKDSPILAFDSLDYFSMEALHFIDGWDGPGWYKDCDEYGMGLNENEAWYHENRCMLYWMPLPEAPK